ncbi:MAG: hypothetical protein ACFFCV_06490 [Promethearchaeota archaeon]
MIEDTHKIKNETDLKNQYSRALDLLESEILDKLMPLLLKGKSKKEKKKQLEIIGNILNGPKHQIYMNALENGLIDEKDLEAIANWTECRFTLLFPNKQPKKFEKLNMHLLKKDLIEIANLRKKVKTFSPTLDGYLEMLYKIIKREYIRRCEAYPLKLIENDLIKTAKIFKLKRKMLIELLMKKYSDILIMNQELKGDESHKYQLLVSIPSLEKKIRTFNAGIDILSESKMQDMAVPDYTFRNILISKMEEIIRCPACGEESMNVIQVVEDKSNIILDYPRVYGKKYRCGRCGQVWREK